MDTTERVIIEVGLTNADYVRKAEETLKKMDALRLQQVQLKAAGEAGGVQFTANAQAIQALGREMKNYTTLATTASNAEKALEASTENATLAYVSETGSINELRARLSILTAQRNAMSAADRDGSEAGKQLTAETAKINAELKGLEKQVGDTRRNVGNYGDSIKDAVASMVPFGEQIATVFEGLKGFKDTLAESSEAAGGFGGGLADAASQGQALAGGIGEGTQAAKIFKVALAGTGIGLLIVAVAALINYLSNLKPVMDFIEVATGALKAGFEVLGRIVFDVGETLIKALSSPVQLIKDIGNFIAHPIEGFKKLGSAAAQAGKDIADAAKAAAELVKAQQDQDDAERNQISNTAKLRLERDKLAVQAKNVTLTEAQRVKLLEEANNKEKAAFAIEQTNTKNRLKLLKEEEAQFIKRNNTAEASDELMNKIAQTQAEVYNQEAASLKFTEKRYNDQAKLQEAAIANEEKAQAAREKIQAKQDEADKVRLESLGVVMAANSTARLNELAAIELDTAEKKKKYQAYGATVVAIEQERLAKIRVLNKQYAEQDATDMKKNLETIADLQISRMSNQGDRELMQIAVTTQRKLDAQDKLIADTYERVQKGEYGLTELLLSQQLLRDEMLADQEEQLFQKNQAIQEERRQKEGQLKEDEIQRAKATKDAKAKIQDEENKIQDDAFALAEGIFGKQTALGKAAILVEKGVAIARIIIKTQEALAADRAAEALENVSLAAVPFAGIGLALANTFKHNAARLRMTIAGAVSAGLVALTAVQGFNTGGLFESDGNGSLVNGAGSGTSDSINAKLSNGEAIINAKSTKRFMPVLSAINVAGGGRSFYNGSADTSFATGGVYNGSNPTDTSQLDINIQNAIIEGMSKVTILTDVKQVYNETQSMLTAKAKQNI